MVFLKAFWDAVSNTAWGAGVVTPHLTVPVMVHADGAQIYRDTEYFVFSMSSASVDSKHLDVIDCKFQILKIPAIQMKDATSTGRGQLGAITHPRKSRKASIPPMFENETVCALFGEIVSL